MMGLFAGMKKNHRLAQAIGDVSWGKMYVRLEQKLHEEGKRLIKIDQHAPSSKSCSRCGSKQAMPLNVRTYVCSSCELIMDRDLNAAINIRNWALQKHYQIASTAGIAESYACGDMNHEYDSAHETTQIGL